MITKDYIFIKDAKLMRKILLKNISHIKGAGDYCEIYTTEKVFRIKFVLESINELLPNDAFYRCHRSYIVNIDRIEVIEENSTFIDGHLVLIARANIKELLQKINFLNELV